MRRPDQSSGYIDTSRGRALPLRADRIDTQNFFSGEAMNTNLMVVEPRAGRWPGLIEAAVIILWGVVQAAAFDLAWTNQPAGDAAESVVARCDRIAQIVSSRNHEARDSQWRRERESAFAACLEGPGSYARSHDVQ